MPHYNVMGVAKAALEASYSEAGVYDAKRRRIRRRPVGWRLTRYAGVAEGRKEFKGYWRGRKAADPSA